MLAILLFGFVGTAHATISSPSGGDGGSVHVPQNSVTTVTFVESSGTESVATVTFSGMGTDCAASFAMAGGFQVKSSNSTTVNLTFTPNKVNTTYTCTGSLFDNATTPNLLGTFSVAGVGVGPVVAAPSSVAFSALRVNDLASTPFTQNKNVTITNSGNGDLAITATAIVGSSDFTISAGGGASTVTAGGGTQTITVTYNPTTVGNATATTLSVTAKDATSNKDYSFSVTLSGSGTGAVITVTPATTLDYGIVGTGGAGVTNHITISNTAAAGTRGPLTVTSATISGGAGWFTFATNAPYNCAGASTCNTPTTTVSATPLNLDIVCNPTPADATGTQMATVTVASDTDSGGDSTATLSCTAGHATLAFSTQTITFPDQRVNTASSAIVLTITNSGNLPGTFTVARTGSTEFATGCTSGTGNVPANNGTTNGTATCSFTFTPTTEANGKTASFTFSTNDLNNGSVLVTTSGNGVEPKLTVTTTPFSSFGNVDIGTSSPMMTITATNNGSQALTISGASLDVNPNNVFTLVGTTGMQTLAAGGGTFSWMVTCTPTVQGAQNGDFKITSDAFTNPNPATALPCSGQRGVLTGNPNPVDFGPVVVNSTNMKTLTLSNTGNLDVSVTAGDLSATNKGYAIHGGFTPFTITAGSTHPVQIDFNPLSTADGGMITLTFTASWTGVSAHTITTVININGSALNADVTLTPSPIDFGTFRFDTPQTVTMCVLNGSMAAVIVSAITVTPNAPTVTNEIAIGAPLKVATGCGGSPTGNFTLGQSLPVGSAILVPVIATPASRIGVLSADIMVTTNIPGNPTRHVMAQGTSTSGMLDVSPMAVDFGPVDVDTGPATKTVVVTNTGSAPFDLKNWTQTTSDPSLTITVPSGTTTLNPTDTATVMLSYDPSAVTAVTGTIGFTPAHLLGGPASGTITVTGRGIDRTFTCNPDSMGVHFPDTFRNPGSKAPIVNVTVTNTGEAPLHIMQIVIDGADYSLADPSQASNLTIPGGGSLPIGVKFTPTSMGAAAPGTMTFMQDDDLRVMAVVSLNGLCILPDIALGPMGTIDLGYTAVGVPVSIDDALTVTNMDPAMQLTVANIQLLDDTGAPVAPNGPFEIVDSPMNLDIAPSSSHSWAVQFNADHDGPFLETASLHVGEDPQEIGHVTIKGTGVFVDLHGGGGCSVGSSGGGGAGLLVVGALLAGLRRRKKRIAVAMVAASSSVALADSPGNLDVGVFNPTPATNIGGFQIISPEVGANGDWVAGGVVSYASKPLVAESSLGEAKLVGARTMFDIGGAYAFLDRFEAGARMPLYSQSGELTGDTTMLQGFTPAKGTARGDLTIHAKGRFVDTNYVTVGAGAEVTLPTATSGQYTGSDLPSVRLLALAALVPHKRLTITGNVGGVIRKKEEAANITQGSGLVWGGGVSFRTLDNLWIAGEVFGEMVPSGHSVMATNGTGMVTKSGLSPIEGLVGVHYRAMTSLTVGAAIGRGLTTGLGSPDLRGVLSITFAPGTPELPPIHPPPPPHIDGDADGDGIKDSKDKCPNEAEDKDGFEDDDGCPDLDNDKDGIPDAQDKCPLDPEDKDGFQDDDGCPDKDNDNDGIPDAQDKCPDKPEDKDGFQDLDGCPDPDNDHDGIPDAQDKCPNDPETINGIADDDGCPDKGDSSVMVSPDRLELLEPVTFSGTKLTKQSFNVLGQVAATLRAHPEIIRVRVTVHAQPTTNTAKDQELTDKRANVVRDWLVQWGIAASRLEARGFGGSKPLVPATSSGAAAVNDRLELIILERK